MLRIENLGDLGGCVAIRLIVAKDLRSRNRILEGVAADPHPFVEVGLIIDDLLTVVDMLLGPEPPDLDSLRLMFQGAVEIADLTGDE